jgi:hypothetical protein
MTGLAQQQAAFMQVLLDESAGLPAGFSKRHAAGISVYRGNYRSALMDTLEATFVRTLGYVGQGPFRRAGAHHLIANPPRGWTIDEAGAGFDQTCAELFAENPEVAELAWLEWTMQQVAHAPDAAPLTPVEIAQASAGFDDADWMQLHLALQPRADARIVHHDLNALWNGEGDTRLAEPRGCIVWREGERPAFMLVAADNARAFAAMAGGASYGEVIALLAGDSADEAELATAAMRAGQMLGEWIGEGLVIALNP